MRQADNPSRRQALGAGVAAAGALVAAPALAQPVTRLKIQTAVPSSSIYFDLMKRMADRVDKMSNGRLKLEMLPDGAVVAAFEAELGIRVGETSADGAVSLEVTPCIGMCDQAPAAMIAKASRTSLPQ